MRRILTLNQRVYQDLLFSIFIISHNILLAVMSHIHNLYIYL